MRFVLITFITLVAFTAFAGEEVVITADGGFALTGGGGNGPTAIDVATDGDATIKFMWFAAGGRSVIVRTEPVASFGETTFALRSALPPRAFTFTGIAGPDSAYVDVSTATEVIVTW